MLVSVEIKHLFLSATAKTVTKQQFIGYLQFGISMNYNLKLTMALSVIGINGDEEILHKIS